MTNMGQLQPVSIAARLRQRWPQIERLLAEGVRHADIVTVLQEEGLAVTLRTFRNYLYQQRKNIEKQQAVLTSIHRSTTVLPPGTGGVMPLQSPNSQTSTVPSMPELPDTMNKHERREALVSHYFPKESHPLLRRNKGA